MVCRRPGRPRGRPRARGDACASGTPTAGRPNCLCTSPATGDAGGAGAALYRTHLATLDRQGSESAYGVATLPNQGSVAFHESLAFERVAHLPAGYKVGTWHDVAWYERPLGDRGDTPAEPTPFADCRDTSWLERTLSATASSGVEAA